MNSSPAKTIDLACPRSLRNSFFFPLQSAASRREVLIGALWLLVPIVGWVMNMGHRIVMVHHMMHGQPAWPAWNHPRAILRHGLITLVGMILYYIPTAIFSLLAIYLDSAMLWVLAATCFTLATLAIPGFMSHYCRDFDPAEIFNPARALRRCLQGGRAYWHAWAIALTALALSFLGLLAFGLGFLITSVWFWQVAGFSFASAFTHRFRLQSESVSA